MPPENLPTIENNVYNNHSESDWWFINELNKLIDFNNNQFINSIKNSSVTKWWKLSLFSTILLLLILIGLNYGYQNKEIVSSLFPTTSEYTVATIQKTKIFPSLFGKLEVISDKFDLTAAMVYLKKIRSKDNGNTIIITEKEEDIILEKPLQIKISKIGVNSVINNPIKNDLNTLNKALGLGAVRYPESGLLGENKNIFIFGHSTSLQTEKDYYKTFNKLETLSEGDEIILESLNNQYIYKVTSIKKTNTANGAIRIDSATPKLTLSTCNTLGAKEDRFVVEANFITKMPLNNSKETTPNNIGENISPSYPLNPTPGEKEETEYIIDPIINPAVEYGLPDLKVVIDEVGVLDINNDFVATSTFTKRNIGAVKFTVKNIGTKTSDGWTFNAVLPTSPSHIFHSAGQKSLAPGERIEFVMGFDKLKIGNQRPIIVNVDPTGGIKESDKTNNIVSKFIDIIEAN